MKLRGLVMLFLFVILVTLAGCGNKTSTKSSPGQVIVNITPYENVTWTYNVRLWGTSDAGNAVDQIKSITTAGAVKFEAVPQGTYIIRVGGGKLDNLLVESLEQNLRVDAGANSSITLRPRAVRTTYLSAVKGVVSQYNGIIFGPNDVTFTANETNADLFLTALGSDTGTYQYRLGSSRPATIALKSSQSLDFLSGKQGFDTLGQVILTPETTFVQSVEGSNMNLSLKCYIVKTHDSGYVRFYFQDSSSGAFSITYNYLPPGVTVFPW